MQLTLTSEQKQLKDGVARFVAERFPASTRRSQLQTGDGIDRASWRDMADLGWVGAGLSEAEGGWGGGPVEMMIVLEGAGYGLAPQPFVPLAVHAMRLAAGARPGGDLVPAMIAGEKLVTVALDDDGAAAVSLRPVDGGYSLKGVKRRVPAADAADAVIVSCTLGDRPAIVHVPLNAEGVSLTGYRTLDDRRAADVIFNKVVTADDDLLATGSAAQALLELAEQHAVAALCAEATGIAQFLLDTTLDYAKTRRQFGQPIGRFQALQHRLADMFVAVEEARSLTIMATVKLTAGDDPADTAHAIAAAKLGVLDRAMHVAREAIQLHGGVGMTEDLPLGAGFRRIKAMSLIYGDENAQLDRMAVGIKGKIYV